MHTAHCVGHTVRSGSHVVWVHANLIDKQLLINRELRSQKINERFLRISAALWAKSINISLAMREIPNGIVNDAKIDILDVLSN